MMKALICGVSGQDGSYLAQLLLDKGYEVVGTSRDSQLNSYSNLKKLGILDSVKLISMAPNDFGNVFKMIMEYMPDEIYNLSGQSSVGLSFEQPVEALESITLSTINFLESIRLLDSKIKFYNAGSSECFGNSAVIPSNEDTPFSPRSPYAVAKLAAYWLVRNYREAFHINACTGILFNHESPLRPDRFVTQKIISTAVRIKHGSDERLTLGNIDIIRDWGWAPEYVDAMWRMMQVDATKDYVISTGIGNSLADFVSKTFEYLQLDWKDYTDLSEELLRPTDIKEVRGDSTRAKKDLKWIPKYGMGDIIKFMVDDRVENA